MKHDGVLAHLETSDRELRHEAAFHFVFEFEIQALVRHDLGAAFEHLRHFVGLDAVVVVRADPHLHLASCAGAECAATIEKGLFHASDFGDVELNGHGVALR